MIIFYLYSNNHPKYIYNRLNQTELSSYQIHFTGTQTFIAYCATHLSQVKVSELHFSFMP